MNTEAITLEQPGAKLIRSKLHIRHGKLLAGYAVLLSLPFVAAQMLNMDNKGLYVTVLSIINLVAMMAFFVQFPLGSRVKQIPLFANIDWSMSKHKTIGQWIGGFFLLHPVLLLAPKFIQSYDDGIRSLVEVITAPQMLTGVIAWVAMIVWTLMAIFKNRLKMSYETWRLTHMLGFVVIAVLATLHITSVGSHGQFDTEFNTLWWVLCSASVLIVAYNYIAKKFIVKAKPFTLVDVTKVSSRDWQVTLEKNGNDDFDFEAGQFVWMNTSGSVFSMNEHPFSIASCRDDLPSLSMVIRELGDYTSQLNTLSVGQEVYIDGPYGSMSLADSKKSDSVLLIAGGAGIGPMLSLLRELAANNDKRPVRLIYGNGDYQQMVLQDEIKALEQQMPDFRQQLVCMEASSEAEMMEGVIDKACISKTMQSMSAGNSSVYLCGPQGMITAVKKSLKSLDIPSSDVHYEQLSF
ncbi:ferredoxin reductase family protein [Vibrio sp. JC009]|uniref:ferredoxin reductase family protein n=1 Tax=Vibrio sp. JC009 TaxID=2912314 RepID=UPI0023AE77DF|nr:ferric reductase-like transmembrane domain-containing protein [Vibrio sp. JC009]WED24696.1 ferredoxin reductase family protein [Vibrio sp. JC009]